jgi:[acyl-carrier-protein] S-malonyltransferase
VLAIVCPGQGSQTPGFLAPWLELDGVRGELGRLSDATGIDLVSHGTMSDAETIKDTAIAQPLIVGAGLVALPPLLGDAATTLAGVGLVAGHSVGEITATAAAGVLDSGDAVVFVRERGRAMAAASAVTPTGMAAVLGGDPDDVLAAIEQHGLTAANVNGAGQTVAAGTLEQIAAFQGDPPAKARVIPLQVAGAFHTEHMAPAVRVLEELASSMATTAPTVTLLSNADGQAVTDGREALDRLVRQVSNPVRWDLCMETMLALGVTGLIELPPAGTLVGLARRVMKGVETLALKTPDELEAAQRMIPEHSGSNPEHSGSNPAHSGSNLEHSATTPSARVDE